MNRFATLSIIILLPVCIPGQNLFHDGGINRRDAVVTVLNTDLDNSTIQIEYLDATGSVRFLVTTGNIVHAFAPEGFRGGCRVSGSADLAATVWNTDPKGLAGYDLWNHLTPVSSNPPPEFIHEVQNQFSAVDSVFYTVPTDTNLPGSAGLRALYDDGIFFDYSYPYAGMNISSNAHEGHAPGYRGWGRLTSTRPTASVVWFPGPDNESHLLPGMSCEDDVIYFPYLARNHESLTSGFRIQNCNTSTPVSLSIDYNDSNGNPVFDFSTPPVPAGEPATLNSLVTSAPDLSFGNCRVSSTTGDPIDGLAEIDLGSGSFYRGVPESETGRNLYLPLVMHEPGGLNSSVFIQNVGPSPANFDIVISGTGLSGSTRSATGSRTGVPSGATTEVDIGSFAPLQSEPFVGVALILNSSQNLAGCVVTDSADDQFVYTAFSENNTKSTLLAPAVLDRFMDVSISEISRTPFGQLRLEWELSPNATAYDLYQRMEPAAATDPGWNFANSASSNWMEIGFPSDSNLIFRVEPR